jgi:choline kinase
MDITFVENTAYDEGNARSLWAARNAVPGPFVLAMADHLIEASLVSDLITGRNGQSALAVDHAAPGDPREGEATLAHVSDGRVMNLGKGIRTWNALDTGVFWCTDDVFNAITREMRDGELGAVFATLARKGQLDAVDVTGRRWLDVDTPEDFAQAESWLDARLAAVS